MVEDQLNELDIRDKLRIKKCPKCSSIGNFDIGTMIPLRVWCNSCHGYFDEFELKDFELKNKK